MENKVDEGSEIQKLRDCWVRGNKLRFRFCKILNGIITERKANEKDLTAFYKEFGLSNSYIQRLKKVGLVFKSYKSDQMVAFNVSQLIRMASMTVVGHYLAKNQIALSVVKLELLKENEEKFHPSFFDHPKDFKALLNKLYKERMETSKLLKDAEKQAEQNEQSEQDKQDDDYANEIESGVKEDLNNLPLIRHNRKCERLSIFKVQIVEKAEKILEYLEEFDADAFRNEKTLGEHLAKNIDLTQLDSDLVEISRKIKDIRELIAKKDKPKFSEEKGTYSSARM